MMQLINSQNISDPIENISFASGVVTSVDHQQNTCDVIIGDSEHKQISIVYNCGDEKPSHAFAIGDEVIVRLYKDIPSHITGFTGVMWPCIKTPTVAITGDTVQIYDTENNIFNHAPDIFSSRYKPLDEYSCVVTPTNYLNSSSATTGDGFTIIQTQWTDTKYHRDTKFYFKDELIYQTYNNETFSGVFNGNRSNVFGYFIHPEADWGCMIYQVNTFYNYLPQTSGRVAFDFFIYISTGIHQHIAHAYTDVTSPSTQAVGNVITDATCTYICDAVYGSIFKAYANISSAGIFTSDGSTNFIAGTDEVIRVYALADNSDNSIIQISSTDLSDDDIKLYIKNR